jgi:hypothetical protein
MIMDYYYDKWNQPNYYPPAYPVYVQPASPLTQEEINDLRELLKRAKKYDEETGQKDCELEAKKEKLRQLAKELNVTIEFP